MDWEYDLTDNDIEFIMTGKLLFLPGASGDTDFWKPVAEGLEFDGEQIHFGWPGFGETPPDPNVSGIDDLVAGVVDKIDGPTVIVAQSMGGVIAVRAALQKPEQVTHLVLSVTSGGIDLSGLGVQDWRPIMMADNPSLPDWFLNDRSDLSSEIIRIGVPVLLLWGDQDPISPVSVGKRLESLFPQSDLHIIEGGGHDLANTHASIVAPLIARHLTK